MDLIGVRCGQYMLTELLHQSSKRRVYRAVGANNEVVAIKILLGRQYTDWLLFEQEIRVLEELDSPHIVRLLSRGRFGNVPGHPKTVFDFFVTEYLHGHCLSDVSLGWQDVFFVLIGVLRALIQTHAKGIVHRDIKPSNIILTANQKVVLIDFGVAFAGENLLENGITLGTPIFMPPEQVWGKKPIPQSDLYSLGLTAYALLTEEFLVRKGSVDSTFRTQVSEELHDTEALREKCPWWVKTWIDWCILKDPKARPESAKVAMDWLTNMSSR